MRDVLGWVVLLVIGITLIITGLRGQVGSVIGAIVTPNDLIDTA